MDLIVSKDHLIIMMNILNWEGRNTFTVREYWRDSVPIISGMIKDRKLIADTISKNDYDRIFPNNPELLSHREFITQVIKSSGMIDQKELDKWIKEFQKLVQDRSVLRGDKPLWFYYDTCALMNNIFYLLNENIKDFSQKASHNISLGVQSELEEIFDRRFKNEQALGPIKSLYNGYEELFLRQPSLGGRIARLAIPQITYFKTRLGITPIGSTRTGDTQILNAFFDHAKHNNYDGIVITADSIFDERARGRQMGSWLFNLSPRGPDRLHTNLDFFANAIFRSCVVFGGITLNEDISIWGVWRGKKAKDWEKELVKVECKPELGNRIKDHIDIVKTIPSNF